MNIFFKHEETRPSHSSLIDDLAWCGHNERISKLEEYKNWMRDISMISSTFAIVFHFIFPFLFV